jgi:hypothetical protein
MSEDTMTTNTDAVPLKQCPFCAHPAQVTEGTGPFFGRVQVECSACRIATFWLEEPVARQLWNKRALLSASKPAAPMDLSAEQRQAVLHHCRLYLDDESGRYNPRAVLTRIFSIAASPAAPAQSGEPVRHVGDSNFEGWYQDYAACITGNPKQTARDAYAAGLNEAAQDVSTGQCFFCGESMDGEHEADCPQSPQPSPTAVVLDERAAFEAWWLKDVPEEHKGAGYALLKNFGDGYAANERCSGAWLAWQARAASPQPVEQTRALTMDEGELDEFDRTVSDFEDDGETSTDYNLLMDWAQRGFLECTHFEVTKAGQDLLTAARPATGGDHD